MLRPSATSQTLRRKKTERRPMRNVVVMDLEDRIARRRRRRRSLLLMAGVLTFGGTLVPLVTLSYEASSAVAVPPSPASTCSPSELVVWLNTQSDAAAGNVLYHLEFTNLSPLSCRLQGFARVVGTGTGGDQLGSPASANHAQPNRPVILPSDGTAFAVLHIAVAGIFPPSRCVQTTAAGLRIYVPDQTTPKVVPFPFPACSRSGPAYLQVEAVETS
jgi:hypothetical protein